MPPFVFSPLRLLAPLGLSLGLTSAGCAGLQVTLINSEQAKPNNVWVFFTVEHGDEPVAGLESSDFQIYEDDSLVSVYESKQIIQNPDVAAVMYTMLLLDMSGSVTESGQVDALVSSAQLFSEQVGATQKVGVYAFDGSEDLYSVVPFTESEGSVAGGLEGLRTFKPKDPSTNLRGAVAAGLEELEKSLEKDKRPLKFGTLVVFSDGSDRAGRVSSEELAERINDDAYAHYELYAMGVGAEIDEKTLEEVGRDGTEMVEDRARVKEAFQRMADRIEAHAKRFYLLSYCTPARKGEHKVRIEAQTKDAKGRKQAQGALEYDFDAEGFGPPPECDPARKPHFRLDENLQPAEQDTDSAGSGGSSKGGARGSVTPPGGGT